MKTYTLYVQRYEGPLGDNGMWPVRLLAEFEAADFDDAKRQATQLAEEECEDRLDPRNGEPWGNADVNDEVYAYSDRRSTGRTYILTPRW